MEPSPSAAKAIFFCFLTERIHPLTSAFSIGASRLRIVAILLPLGLPCVAPEMFLPPCLRKCALPRADRHALIPAN